MSPKHAFIGVGSNLGDRETFLALAIELLSSANIGQLTDSSEIFQTEPVGGPPQDSYLNLVLALTTTLTPLQLLQQLLQIELLCGRTRSLHWGPRHLDLDLLMVEQLVESMQTEPPLELPHPRLHQRKFVLQPLAQLAPQLQHPTFSVSIRELLLACSDQSAVVPYRPQSDRLQRAFELIQSPN